MGALTLELRRPGVLFGRNVRTRNLFTLAHEDRTTHCHVIGASKQGKSNAIEVMIRQDILQNDGVPRGVSVIDPHGSLFTSLVAWIAEHRIWRFRRIIMIDPTDDSASVSINPFLALSTFDRTTLAEILTNATLSAFGQSAVTQTPMIAEVLQELYSALGALGLPLAHAPDFLYREHALLRGHHLERLAQLDPDCAAFWQDLEKLPAARRDEYLAPVRRRLKQFLRPPNTKRLFCQRGRALDVAAEMDRGSVVLVNLKQGEHLSGDSARLLGALLVNEYYTACFRRRNKLQHFLYVDECQRFLSQDVARILDESRKFGLSMVLSHQHLSHLREAGEEIFRSVMTNSLVKVVFGGLDPEDAEYMAKLVFRGTLDLQKAKARHYRMTAVGTEKVMVRNESRGTSDSVTNGQSWSQGSTVGSSSSTTASKAKTKSKAQSHTESASTAETDSWSRSHTDSWAESQGESSDSATVKTSSDSRSSSVGYSYEPTLLPPTLNDTLVMSEGSGTGHTDSSGTVESASTSFSSTRGGSDTETVGGSTTRSRGTADTTTKGVAVTTGTAVTTGSSRSESAERGGSTARSAGSSMSEGSSETYVPRYERVAGPLWDLNEQLHVKGVAIAHCPVGQAWVRIGSKLPRRLVLPYLGESDVLPERVTRVRRKLLERVSCIAPADQVEAEYAAHRAELSRAATGPVEEPETWREGGN